jgi:cytochrome c biogenesis protein CcmG/thiol:disulfide interchange protein DsbE
MSKSTKTIIAVATGLVALMLLLAARQRPTHALEIGDRVPAFALPLQPGGTVDVRQFQNHVVVLNFWATWCPPCIDEAPSLEKFARQMRPRGVEVIGVSVDHDSNALGQFISKYDLTFPIARDPDQRLANGLGTFKFPETYILDRSGRVAEKIIGETNWEDPRMIQYVSAMADWRHAPTAPTGGAVNY